MLLKGVQMLGLVVPHRQIQRQTETETETETETYSDRDSDSDSDEGGATDRCLP